MSIDDLDNTSLGVLVFVLAARPGQLALLAETLFLVLPVVVGYASLVTADGLRHVRFKGQFSVVGDVRPEIFLVYAASDYRIQSLIGGIRELVSDDFRELLPPLNIGLFLCPDLLLNVNAVLVWLRIRFAIQQLGVRLSGRLHHWLPSGEKLSIYTTYVACRNRSASLGLTACVETFQPE